MFYGERDERSDGQGQPHADRQPLSEVGNPHAAAGDPAPDAGGHMEGESMAQDDAPSRPQEQQPSGHDRNVSRSGLGSLAAMLSDDSFGFNSPATRAPEQPQVEWDSNIGLFDSKGIASERFSYESYLGPAHRREEEDEFDESKQLLIAPTPRVEDPNSMWSDPNIQFKINQETEQDFITVDWAYYAQKDRERSARLGEQLETMPAFEKWTAKAWDGAQSWLALMLIGFLTGVISAVISMGVDWFTDLRFGYCKGKGWWVTKEICCKTQGGEVCPEWSKWSDEYSSYHWVPASQDSWVEFGFYAGISSVLAMLAAWLVLSFAPYAAGSGISEVKVVLGGFVIKRLLGGWTLLAKSLGLMLVVGSGMMVGKEGPCVHIACCVANIISRMFSKFKDNEARKRELFSSASAAGVAVAFGAPVGGVLFALEEVSSYFPPKTMWRSIFCSIIAAITIARLDPLKNHKSVIFEVTYHHDWQLFELFPFALLGAIGGLVGAAFNKINPLVCQKRRSSWIKKWPITEVAVVCMFTSMIHFPFKLLRSNNMILLHDLFSACDEEYHDAICSTESPQLVLLYLVITGIAKLSLTVITYGLKIPGGLFVPSLTVGALFGRALGFAMKMTQEFVGDEGVFADCAHTSQCVNPAIYAIIGAASVLGGVTRMTVSLVVIMIELTNGLQYIIPLIIAIMVSKFVSEAFDGESIYIEHIRLNGYPLLDTGKDHIFDDSTVATLLGRELKVLSMTGETVQSISQMLDGTFYKGFPVVTSHSEMLVVGYIRRQILKRMIEKARSDSRVSFRTPCAFSRSFMPASGPWIDLSPYLDRSPDIVFHSTPLSRVYEMFRAVGLRYLLVTNDGKLIGIVKKKDLLEHLDYERMRKAAGDRRRGSQDEG